jgi:hypothetical protein
MLIYIVALSLIELTIYGIDRNLAELGNGRFVYNLIGLLLYRKNLQSIEESGWHLLSIIVFCFQIVHGNRDPGYNHIHEEYSLHQRIILMEQSGISKIPNLKRILQIRASRIWW